LTAEASALLVPERFGSDASKDSDSGGEAAFFGKDWAGADSEDPAPAEVAFRFLRFRAMENVLA